MVVNRVIDNAAVAAASIARKPVVSARSQALSHPVSIGGDGATVFGADAARHTSPEWAAWANGVAVRELDYHDTFLAAEYSHPGDNIPPIIAVAQHLAAKRGLTGRDLVRGIATGYEIQIDLVKAISLHEHKIDHVAHLGPSAAAGIGTLLGLDQETIFQAIGQALHTTTATRQSRKGEISTWKAHAPAFAGKMASRRSTARCAARPAPCRSTRARTASSPGCSTDPEGSYEVPLPDAGEAKRAILDSYTKEHSAEYQAQAWIDLARKLHAEYPLILDARPHRVDHAAHLAPHALRHRLGRERPAEVRPRRLARDARPLDSRTSSRSPCRTARGTTPTPTRPSAHTATTRSRCGRRSRPSRTPSGPAATTRTTSTRRPSAAAS